MIQILLVMNEMLSLKILRMIKGESFLESYFEKLDLADQVFSR